VTGHHRNGGEKERRDERDPAFSITRAQAMSAHAMSGSVALESQATPDGDEISVPTRRWVMSRLIPGLPTDVFKRIDDLIADVRSLLGRVDDTLATVSSTLTDVEGTLEQATSTLNEATAVLTDVKVLLTDLESKLELLDDVPAMRAQLDEVHAILTTLVGGDAGTARKSKK